ncbi:MAG: hypothetical protein ACHQ49_17840, partial [Elusimicrobiota bacterium]
MLRALIAALYLITIPGASAWAQVAQAVRVPAALSSLPLAAPVLTAPLGVPAPSFGALGAPSLAGVPALSAAPAAAANTTSAAAAPSAAVLAAAPALSAAPRLAAVDDAPSSLSAARSSAFAASDVAARPGAAESDSARVDFAD